MCTEPTSLAMLMAKADKYATADSAMRIKVTALDKVVPAPATPKPAGDNRDGQNNYKRKADQMDPRSNNKLVANVEGDASASQAGPPRKRRNQGNPNWLPRQSLEQLLDAPCKIHSGATPSTHTLRQCSVARRLSQWEGLLAPPAPPAPLVMPAVDPTPAALKATAPNAAPTESTVQAPSAPPTTPASDPLAPLVQPTPTAAPTTTTTPALSGLESSQWVDVMEIDSEPVAAIAPETPSSSGAAEAPNS
ncbi:hypothetical protein D1007_10290 [Hordeum vulgare]|nr:hypothetical protein D1007_10290 [Hordeum vulgare]